MSGTLEPTIKRYLKHPQGFRQGGSSGGNAAPGGVPDSGNSRPTCRTSAAVFHAARPSLRPKRGTFGFYAADFIIDDQLHVYVTEVCPLSPTLPAIPLVGFTLETTPGIGMHRK